MLSASQALNPMRYEELLEPELSQAQSHQTQYRHLPGKVSCSHRRYESENSRFRSLDDNQKATMEKVHQVLRWLQA